MKRILLISIIFFMFECFGFTKVLNIKTPNGGENWVLGSKNNITWNASGMTNKLKLTLWRNGILIGLIVKDQTPSSDKYNWIVGKYIGGNASTGTGYKIKIREQGGAAFKTQDMSDLNFTISPSNSAITFSNGALTLTEPSGQDVLMTGSYFAIKWKTFSISGFVKLTLWHFNKFVGTIANRVEAKNRIYNWKVGTILSDRSRGARGIVQLKSGYKIKIESLDNSSIYNYTIFPFEIAMASAIIKNKTLAKVVTIPDPRLFIKGKIDGEVGFGEGNSFAYYTNDRKKIAGFELILYVNSKNDFQVVDSGNSGAGTFAINVSGKTWDRSTLKQPISRPISTEVFSISGKAKNINIGKINMYLNKNHIFKGGQSTIAMSIRFKQPITVIGIESRIRDPKTKRISHCELAWPSFNITLWYDTVNGVKQIVRTFKLRRKELLYFIDFELDTSGLAKWRDPCNLTKNKWVPGFN